jgi:hypothetical protein
MSYRPQPPSREQDATRMSGAVSDTGQTGQKEPFIKQRDTWHTFGLPPGAPPRQGLVGFIKYVASIS